jgi:hypothetical protein
MRRISVTEARRRQRNREKKQQEHFSLSVLLGFSVSRGFSVLQTKIIVAFAMIFLAVERRFDMISTQSVRYAQNGRLQAAELNPDAVTVSKQGHFGAQLARCARMPGW